MIFGPFLHSPSKRLALHRTDDPGVGYGAKRQRRSSAKRVKQVAFSKCKIAASLSAVKNRVVAEDSEEEGAIFLPICRSQTRNNHCLHRSHNYQNPTSNQNLKSVIPNIFLI